LTVLGEFDKSLIETYQAIQLSVDLTEDYLFDSGDNNNPSAHDRWWLRLRSMYMAADTYRRKGELDKAMEVLSETIKLAEPAVNKLPSLASNYADIIYMLCNTRYQIKVDQEVLKICIKSAKLSEQLLDSKPEEFRLIFNHAIDIGFLSNIYLELNQTQKALETVDKAIELTQKLNQWDPDNKTVENDLVSNLNIKGQILYEKGDLLASQSLFEKSYQIIMRLAKDNEEMHFAHNKLYSEIYLNKLDEAQITADFLKSKGMKTKDLLELFAELDNRINNNFNEE